MDHRTVLARSPWPAAGVSSTSAPRMQCRLAAADRDRRAHFAIRHEVFVTEQKFFPGTDRDEHDREPGTRHVLAASGATAAGAVRVYPVDEPGLWRGDRLAVLPEFRSQGVGAPLVRFAVTTAAELGGRCMVAYIQPQNISFFEHLGWHQIGGEVSYIGHPHLLVAIKLPTRAGRNGDGQPD